MITRARDNKAIWPCERVSLGDGDAVGGEKWRCGDAVRRNSNGRETEQNANANDDENDDDDDDERNKRNFVCGANLKLPP